MKQLKGIDYVGERPLFQCHDAEIVDCYFHDGESPLKESKNIHLIGSTFQWKYPVWYSRNVLMENCTLLEGARAGIWYTNNVIMRDCLIDAPKTFRKCKNISLVGVEINDAQETFWNCNGIKLKHVKVRGDYFCLNSKNIIAEDLRIDGKYCFDGGENIEIHNAILNTKDCFWNCKHVKVYDSEIDSEYVGWNSEDVTFVNCRIRSLQGFCYMKKLKMVNCRLWETNLAFEFSDIDAEIVGNIDSVKNISSGKLKCGSIGELIMDDKVIDPSNTTIELDGSK